MKNFGDIYGCIILKAWQEFATAANWFTDILPMIISNITVSNLTVDALVYVWIASSPSLATKKLLFTSWQLVQAFEG